MAKKFLLYFIFIISPFWGMSEEKSSEGGGVAMKEGKSQQLMKLLGIKSSSYSSNSSSSSSRSPVRF